MEIKNYIPNIPIADYLKIKKDAETNFPEDFEKQLKFITEQTGAIREIEKIRISYKKSSFEFGKKVAEKFYPNDKREQSLILREWIDFYENVIEMSKQFGRGTFKKILETAINTSDGYVNQAQLYVQNQYEAMLFFRELKPFDIPKERFEKTLKEAEINYPFDYEKRKKSVQDNLVKIREEERIKKFSREKKIIEDAKKKAKLLSDSQYVEKNGINKNELYNFLNENVFTKKYQMGKPCVGVYALFKGKPVVFCTKEYIGDSMPIVFSNSRMTITCSKAYVAANLPIIACIPDKQPQIKPVLKVVDNESSPNIIGKDLLMYNPYSNIIDISSLKIVSESQMHYNVEKDNGMNNSVIIDYENKLFIGIALELFIPGIFDNTDNNFVTLTSLGYGSKIPNIESFASELNDEGGTLSDLIEKQIFYPRINSISEWEPFDFSKFRRQKDNIILLTSRNNDFLYFFHHRNIGYALNNASLNAVARKHMGLIRGLKRLNLDARTIQERYYKYLLDVEFELSKHLKDTRWKEHCYSINRDEFMFQYLLLKSMSKYFSDHLRSGDYNKFFRQEIGELLYNM